MMPNLLEIAERCEAATGMERQLEAEIYVAVKSFENWEALTPNGGVADCVPTYTASLDAAMTLVPEGWRWVMREACPDKSNPNERGFFARLETRDFESVTWGKGSDWLTDVVAGQDVFCWAATPALALCAASLRARAAVDLARSEAAADTQAMQSREAY